MEINGLDGKGMVEVGVQGGEFFGTARELFSYHPVFVGVLTPSLCHVHSYPVPACTWGPPIWTKSSSLFHPAREQNES